ncbi:hypothetical protein, partial [Salmonella enterica]|uniref:hypothetical protein n=1 Tax=Salmonella enterica TaxID=28901 RepID=UPI0020A4A939
LAEKKAEFDSYKAEDIAALNAANKATVAAYKPTAETIEAYTAETIGAALTEYKGKVDTFLGLAEKINIEAARLWNTEVVGGDNGGPN